MDAEYQNHQTVYGGGHIRISVLCAPRERFGVIRSFENFIILHKESSKMSHCFIHDVCSVLI